MKNEVSNKKFVAEIRFIVKTTDIVIVRIARSRSLEKGRYNGKLF